ncbi:MAG: small ribosomal subunit Rsm22 family protein [Polyangiales bacterium]
MAPPVEDACAPALVAALGRPVEPRLLARMVARQSARYHGDEVSIAHADSLAARALFFLPRDMGKLHRPVAELALADALPRRPLRVLDLGAGVGASAVGVARALPSTSPPESLTAVDIDPQALALLSRVCDHAAKAGLVPAGTRVETAVRDLSRPGWSEGLGRHDLVCVGLALVEITAEFTDEAERGEAMAAVLREAMTLVADDGALVVIEPATKAETRALHHARASLLAGGATVFAPCLHAGPCPMLATERDWCHEDDDEGALPPWLVPIAKEAGLRWEGPTYSYLTLRKDGRALGARVRGDGDFVPVRTVSRPLVTKGKAEAWWCGPFSDAVTGVKALELDRVSKGEGDRVAELPRGSLLRVRRESVQGAEMGRALRVSPKERERVR